MNPTQARAPRVDRREFQTSVMAAAMAGIASAPVGRLAANTRGSEPVVDTHMHVWAKDLKRFPFSHPYQQDFREAPHDGTLEMLIDDMDQHGCTHSVLVQVIYHGWDNSYVAECIRRYPDRLRAHGLIDPTDPKVAEKLEYWMKEHGLHGMRFSPIYYRDGQHGGDSWLDADHTHQLWRTAAKLGAVFNFFIAPTQLAKLERMVAAHPDVPIIIDHLSQMDLGVEDPEPAMRSLIRMAHYPNVLVKVSELTSVSKSGEYPFTDAYPYVRRVAEAFGPTRLLFGTGYPGSARAAYKRPTLGREIALIRQMPFWSPDEQQMILGGNAVRLWNLKTSA